tara:strand:+ start:3716 stop:4897 length:1182 start_codon:yes stop_codon:yes gene_type:complete
MGTATLDAQLFRVCTAQFVASLTTQMSTPFFSFLLLERWNVRTSGLAALFSVANLANVAALLGAPLWLGRTDARSQLIFATTLRVMFGLFLTLGAMRARLDVLFLAQVANGASQISLMSSCNWIIGRSEMENHRRTAAVATLQVSAVCGLALGPPASVALLRVLPRAELMGMLGVMLNAVGTWQLCGIDRVATAASMCERPPRDSVDIFVIAACTCGSALAWESVMNAILQTMYGLSVDATFPYWTALSGAAVVGSLLAPNAVGVLAPGRLAWCMAALGAVGWGMLVGLGRDVPSQVQFGVALFSYNSMNFMLYSLNLMNVTRRYAPHAAYQLNWLMQITCQLGRAVCNVLLSRILDGSTTVHAAVGTSVAVGTAAHIVHIFTTREARQGRLL